MALAAHDFDKLTDTQIARKYGVGRTAITMRRCRARATLKRYAAALNKGNPRRVRFKPFSLLSSDNV